MNYSGFLRPLWTWLLRDDPEPEQQEQFWGIAVGVPQPRRRAGGRRAARFRAGVPWESVAPLVEPARQPRHARFRTIAGYARNATSSASDCR